ncbi:MAG: hypothetical protein R2838_19535 [Caldilineaceae bacterium]
MDHHARVPAPGRPGPAARRRGRLGAAARGLGDGGGWPGRLDWRSADARSDDIVAAGMAPVLVLDGSPAWK